MRRGSTWFAVASLAALLVVSGATAGTAAKPRRGGTLIYGADQEPGTLNPFVAGGGHAAIALAHGPTMAGTFLVTPGGTYKNDVVSRVKFTRKPFTVTYFIKKEARWSDGKPLTAHDYLFTFQTFISKRWNILVTIGYEDIARAKVVNAKTFKVVYRKPFAGWRDLFPEVLPRHALLGEDFDNVWRNAIDNPKTGRPIASGPFVFQRWNRGASMTLVRNERYWGPKAMLDRIVFRFIPDTNTQVQQLRSGEVDMMAPQVQPVFTALKEIRGLKTLTSLGPVWEKVDFNFGYRGNGHPLLRKRFVRQAIAHGLDRRGIVRTVFGRVLPGIEMPVLNSGILMASSAFHKPHWGQYAYDPAKAGRLMQQNGCRRGGDGIFVCAGQRASFRWTSTTGNQRREFTFEIAQAQLKNVGIELKSDFAAAATAFGPKKESGDYDLFDYAWVSSSPDVSGWDSIYGCRTDVEAQQNAQGYCNRTVDRLLKRANAELDQKKQAALINQALAIMARDLVVLPLYQLPGMVIHRTNVRGVVANPYGLFWTVRQWWKATS